MSAPLSTHPFTHSESLSVRTVLLGMLVVLSAMGTRATFGLFMQPMGLAQGWSREVFALAFAWQNLVWGAASIFMGMLADRYGSGRTVALGALLAAMGLVGMRFASTEMELYLSAGLLVGLGQAGITFPVILPVVARVVPPASRSTAMGIVSAGGSLGQFLVVPAGQWMIDTMQWQGALWGLSLLVAVGIPLALGLRGRPIAAAGQLHQSMGAAVRQAFTHPSFHFLFWSYFVCGFHTAFITLNLPGYVIDKGLNASTGAVGLALVGLFNVLGSFGAGKLGGIYSKKRLLAWIYGLRAVGIIWLLWLPSSPFVVYVFSAWMGLFWLGTVPLTQGLIGHIYGMRYAATLSGIVFLGHQVGSFVGVWLGGRVYAETGSYDLVWWISVALALLAAVLCLPVRERPLMVVPGAVPSGSGV